MLEMLEIQRHVKHINNMRLVMNKGFFYCFNIDINKYPAMSIGLRTVP